jgi:tripartite-type tricarboxylate transporter receptor subunit TctC
MRSANICKLAQVVVALGIFQGVALAQSAYPSKPVRVISPLGSSGAVEIMGRLVTGKMSESMGQQFVVESRIGAGGTVGHEAVAKAAPDGYTVLLTGSGYTIMPSIYSIKFDPLKDLVPVSQMSLGSYLLMVPNAMSVKTVKDLVALAKAKPGALNFGSTGVGSSVHFATERFASAAGVKLTHVPYKTLGSSYVDLMAGEIQLIMSNTISALPHVKIGKARALGVTSLRRLAALPDIPTASESGVPGFSAPVWTAIFAPARTPPEILARLTSEVVKAVNHPDMVARAEAEGGEPIQPLEQFRQTIYKELADNRKIAQALNIKPE